MRIGNGFPAALLDFTGKAANPANSSPVKTGSNDAVRVSLSNVGFSNRLEKHLDDHAKGKGYLSSGINSELREKALDSSSRLASINPKALSSYLAVSTSLGYKQKSRLVSTFSSTVDSISRLKAIYDNAPTEEEVIEQFAGKSSESEEA